MNFFRIEQPGGKYVEFSDDLGAYAVAICDGTNTSAIYAAADGIGIYDGAVAATLRTSVISRGTDQTEISDGGTGTAIDVDTNGYCPLVSTGAQTRTLAAPSFIGQRVTLFLKTDGGDVVVTCATGLNQTGNNTATFNDAGDVLVLQAIEVGSNKRWRVVANDGVTLSTV